MTRILPAACALLLLAHPSPAAAKTPSGKEIIDRVLDADPLALMNAETKGRIVLRDKRNTTSQMVFQAQARRHGRGLSRTLVRFSAPADIAGTGFLQIQREGADDDRFLFVPELKRSRRIAGALRSSAFMGTDFSYADLDLADLRESTSKVVGEEKIGAHDHWRLEVVPSRKDSQYSRFEIWVRKDNHLVFRWRMYDRGGKLFKTFQALQFQRKDGTWFVARSQLTNHRDDHVTELILDDVRPGADVPDEVFPVRNLEKL
jgi:uncharacterized protein